MSVYLDTSALAKLAVIESETAALRSWLGARPGTPRLTNSVGVVELRQVASRVGPAALTAAAQLLARIDELALTPLALARAGDLPPPEIRTLDALQIASAAELDDLAAVVTYDHRMISACRGYGLPVVSPGIA